MKLIPRALLRGPISMVHFVTRNCNARCSHCFIDFDDPATFKGDLRLEEIDRVSRSVGWQLQNVNLTGGEPFLRKDLFDVARCYLDHTSIRSLYITTNGYFTDRTREFVERYLEAGYDRDHHLFFSLSIDDLPAAHDANRRVPRLFERAMETLRWLEQHRDRRVLVNVNLTVIPANADRIGDIYEYLVADQGVRAFTTTIMREEGIARIDPAARTRLSDAYSDLNARIHRDMASGRIQAPQGETKTRGNMNFQDFLLELDFLGYGVVAFNTYKQRTIQKIDYFNFYLMVANAGKQGQFWKVEGEVDNMGALLDEFISEIQGGKK